MVDISTGISVVALGLSAGGMLYNWRRNAGTDTKAIWTAIAATNSDVAVLKKQGDLFWGLVEQQMAKALIRPTHIELDRLLEKLVKREKLTPADEIRLQDMLSETVHNKDEIAGVRAMAATILAIRLGKQELRKRL